MTDVNRTEARTSYVVAGVASSLLGEGGRTPSREQSAKSGGVAVLTGAGVGGSRRQQDSTWKPGGSRRIRDRVVAALRAGFPGEEVCGGRAGSPCHTAPPLSSCTVNPSDEGAG